MKTKIQQLTFEKGITRIPSEAICSDNTLADAAGLTYDNGEYRVIQPPKRKVSLAYTETRGSATVEIKLLFVHKVNGTERYIFKEGSYVTFANVTYTNNNATLSETSNPSNTTVPADANTKVTSIGKTLVITSPTNGVWYMVWNEDGYKAYNEIPEQDVRFFLKSSYTYTTGDDKQPSGTHVVSNSLEADIWDSHFDIKDQKTYNNVVVGLYAKNKMAIAQKKAFCLPFFVRTALKLFDGSYTHISQPILLFPSVRGNTWMPYSKVTDNSDTMVLSTFFSDLYCANSSNLAGLEDIVKAITVFITPPIEIYDTEVDQPNALPHINVFAVGHEETTEGYKGTIDGVFTNSSYSYQSVYRKLENQLGGPKRKAENEIADSIKAASNFFKLCDLEIVGNSSGQNLAGLFSTHTLENIMTQEQLKHDDFHSYCKMYAERAYSYNARLNLTGIKRGFFNGFKHFTAINSGSSSTTSHTITVNINTDSGDRVVQRSFSSNEVIGTWFFYPDSRADHVTITNGSSTFSAPLTEHPSLNGAYYFAGLPSSSALSSPSNTSLSYSTSPAPELLHNQIATSEVNNPFVFYAEGYNAVGTGNIMAIAATTQALSQGQFGQFPLIVFSSDGIWALSVGATGLYSAAHPIARDVCINPNTVTQTDNNIFFVSEKGLMCIAGSLVTCVSEQLLGKRRIDNTTDRESDLNEVMLAYDYRDSLLWLIHSNVQDELRYALVLNTKSMTISKVQFLGAVGNTKLRIPRNIVTDYPDTLIQDDAGIFSFAKRPARRDDNDNYSAFLVSRTLKLENAMALKSVLQIKHIMELSTGANMVATLYGGNKLFPTKILTSLRGLPWKYYRIKLNFTNIKATDTYAGTLFVTQERRNLRLR